MDLTPEQKRIAKKIVRTGRKRGESREKILAALATGLVESNLRNLNYGDADSQGWRQERASLYKNPTNLNASINRFYDETDQHFKGQSIGELAADVQRPAEQYRGRYAERLPDAKRLLSQVGSKGSARAFTKGGAKSRFAPPSFETTPGVDNSAARQVLLQGYLGERGEPDALLTLAAGLSQAQDVAPSTTLVPGQRAGGQGGGQTLVIGDSLGVGTAPELKRLLGGKVHADVKVGRPSDRGVKRLRRALQSGSYDRIVFDLGTNDMSAKELQQSLRRAQQLAGGVPIYAATVVGPDAERKNRVLRKSGVNLVDWAGKADGYLAGDGIHATPEGYEARARLFARAMGVKQRGAGGGKSFGINELFHDPMGWYLDEGKQVSGAIGGHGGHLHAGTYNPRDADRIGRLAQRMGLHVAENETFDHVDPVHTAGSLHYSDRAVDVSGDPAKLRKLAKKLRRRR